MKKIIALVLALMMALSCVGAMADETADMIGMDDETMDMIGMYAGAILDSIPQQGYGVQMVQVDKDQLMNLVTAFTGTGEEEQGIDPAIIGSLINLLNACSVSATYDLENKMAEFVLAINDTPIVNFSVMVAEGNIMFFSDLIPTYALSISVDTLTALVEMVKEMVAPYIALIEEEIMAAMPALMAATVKLPEAIAPLTALLEGPFETGDEEYDTVYVMQTTANEYFGLMLDAAVAVLEDETVATYLTEKTGMNLAEVLMEKGSELLAESEENDFPMIVAEYINSETGDISVEADVLLGELMESILIDIQGANVNMCFCLGNAEDDFSVIYDKAHTTGETMWAEFGTNLVEGYTYSDIAVAGIMMYIEEYIIEQDENHVITESDLYFGDSEMPMISELQGVFFNACEFLEDSFNTENVQFIAIESLLGGDEEAAGLLLEDLSANGLATVLGSIMTAMPEDAMNILGLLAAFME